MIIHISMKWDTTRYPIRAIIKTNRNGWFLFFLKFLSGHISTLNLQHLNKLSSKSYTLYATSNYSLDKRQHWLVCVALCTPYQCYYHTPSKMSKKKKKNRVQKQCNYARLLYTSTACTACVIYIQHILTTFGYTFRTTNLYLKIIPLYKRILSVWEFTESCIYIYIYNVPKKISI